MDTGPFAVADLALARRAGLAQNAIESTGDSRVRLPRTIDPEGFDAMAAPAAAPAAPLHQSRQDRLAALVIVRLAAGAATEHELSAHLAAWLGPGPGLNVGKDGGASRGELVRVVHGLLEHRLVSDSAGKLETTNAGKALAIRFLGLSDEAAIGSWPHVRDRLLPAIALGIATAAPARRKAAERLDGLRGLIVETAFGIASKGRPSAQRIRSRLAVLALERAFGDGIKAGLSAKTAMSPKASRLLAGQLAAKPRAHSSDARLVAQLAADAVGAKRSEVGQLRAAVVRRWLADGTLLRRLDKPEAAQTPRASTPASDAQRSSTGSSRAPHERAEAPALESSGQAPPRRPGPAEFALAVKAAAQAKAEGWAGNRKAFVSHVWAIIQERHAGWGLSEIEFKAMLVEAQRQGLIALANADLKDRRSLAEIEASAVSYKNAVWHYVRVLEREDA
jgi:hypothetical protein